MWESVADLLPDDWGLTLYDLRGHGLSDGAGSAMSEHAADLLALTRRGAVVCGLSIGGQIAMRAALDAPGHMRGLVLCATAPRIGDPGRYGDRSARVKREGMAAFAVEQMERWFTPSFASARPAVVDGARAALAAQDVEGYRAASAAIGGTDMWDDLRAIRVPTLCIAGAKDGSTDPQTMQAMTACLPHAELVVLDGIGHLPPVEVPEKVVQCIVPFVRRIYEGA